MLSHPSISFNIISNEKVFYDVRQEKLRERINSIYGNTYAQNIIKVHNINEPYRINGYIGTLSILKKRRGNQFLFLNGRFIQNRLLNSAIFSAYQSVIKRGEFPFFCLDLKMPPDLFDINVHPAKLEVRFHNEWHIYHLLKSSTIKALEDIINVIPNYHNKQYEINRPTVQSDTLPFSSNTFTTMNDQAPHKVINNSNESNITLNNIVNDRINEISKLEKTTFNLESTSDHIWQIHNKYLITEIKSGLIIIDQHVAHERILFEEAKSAIENKGLSSQALLFPQTIKMQPEEYDILTSITHYLEKIGFKFREFGENTIIIEGIPANLKWGNESNIIKEIIDQYIDLKIKDNSFVDNIAAIYACKSAIKAGDPLKPIERRSLIDGLFATKHPYYCPHGRPIIINLSIGDLDERFERH